VDLKLTAIADQMLAEIRDNVSGESRCEMILFVNKLAMKALTEGKIDEANALSVASSAIAIVDNLLTQKEET
jgi:hypothetical protein